MSASNNADRRLDDPEFRLFLALLASAGAGGGLIVLAEATGSPVLLVIALTATIGVTTSVAMRGAQLDAAEKEKQ